MTDDTEAERQIRNGAYFFGSEVDGLPFRTLEKEKGRNGFYKRVCVRNSWHLWMQMILKEGHFLGIVTLYRTVGKDFWEDVFILDTLKEHLTFRLAREVKNGNEGEGKITVREAAQQYGLTHREETVLSLLMQGKGTSRKSATPLRSARIP